MTDIAVTILVVAKAPVPGLAKTRLAATVGDLAAADIAAAALLDTLDAVAATPCAARVVAITGDLDRASHRDEIRGRLSAFTVVDQRGDGFAERLANAHADAAAVAGDRPVLQIGMDTPQVTPELLGFCGQALLDAPAVLGMARDGGWWVLGVRSAEMAACLRDVPMSTSETGALTHMALQHNAIDVTLLPDLHDVDTVDDVDTVRDVCPPGSRFADATRMAGV
ncbi:DUF2064 domain-containing protein [soil metagenome]